MFISCTGGAANGFKKWSAAHPAAKNMPPNLTKRQPIVPAVADAGSPQAESARSSRPMTYCEHSAVHMRRALQLREAAEAASVGFPLRARSNSLALQYDRMVSRVGSDTPEVRQMRDE
jgi:hypothetical protein